MDSLPYLPSPSLRLSSCQLAEWLHGRLLFAVLGVTSVRFLLDVCVCVCVNGKKTPRILGDIPACEVEPETERRFSQAKLAAARHYGWGWIFLYFGPPTANIKTPQEYVVEQ